METKFREISELMDDSNDKMPEGIYLALYNKLKELRDESNKNTEVDSDDDSYYEHGARQDPEYERIVRELDLWRSGALETWSARQQHTRQYLSRVHYEHENKELKDKIKELEEAALRSRPRCKCGSTTHRNPNALVCRLNKRVLAGDYGTVERDRALAETADVRWRDALTVGTVIDAQDSDKKWFDAVITTVDGDLLGVHYRGWRAKWDDKNVPRSSERIQPLHTHTPHWREFTLGDQVEVRVGPGPKWYRGSVTCLAAQRRVKITVASHPPLLPPPPMWLDFDSEDVCRLGTHIPRRRRRSPPL